MTAGTAGGTTSARRGRCGAYLPPEPEPETETGPAAGVSWLTGRFPGVPIWFGRHTGRFWALVRPGGRPRLVEAVTPQELATAIAYAGGRPWPS